MEQYYLEGRDVQTLIFLLLGSSSLSSELSSLLSSSLESLDSSFFAVFLAPALVALDTPFWQTKRAIRNQLERKNQIGRQHAPTQKKGKTK